MKDTYLSFRVEAELKERLKALAIQNERTLSQMSLILLREALVERECTELIRQAFGGEKEQGGNENG